jgi:hypothetical protein
VERAHVPTLDELPVLELPPVLSPAERARSWRPRNDPRRLERFCRRDGIPLGRHTVCLGCGALSGPGHPVAPFLVLGRCPGCRGAA